VTEPPEVMGATKARPLGVLGTVRAFGVMLGGSVVLVAGAGASVASVVRALAGRQRPRAWAFLGVLASAAYAAVIRPWHLRWGSEPREESMALPGDELLPEQGTQILHAVTVNAPVEEVWSWVAQLGQDRGGMYSYEWLENLAGCEMRNSDGVHPEWQERRVGETMFLHPAGGLEVTLFDPPRALGIRNWGNIVLVPQGSDRTRLIVRGRIPRGVLAAGYALLMEVPHFIMERKMLLGIKERAESEAANRAG
jgi:hypothetical protein